MRKWFSGLTLILLGTLALLQNFEAYQFGLTFWTTILIWLGLEMLWSSLFKRWRGPSFFGAAVGLFVAGLGVLQALGNAGVPFALSTSDLIRMGWPLLLVAAGLTLLVGGRHWDVG